MEEDLKKLTPDVVLGGILMNEYFDVAPDEFVLPYFRRVKYSQAQMGTACADCSIVHNWERWRSAFRR